MLEFCFSDEFSEFSVVKRVVCKFGCGAFFKEAKYSVLREVVYKFGFKLI